MLKYAIAKVIKSNTIQNQQTLTLQLLDKLILKRFTVVVTELKNYSSKDAYVEIVWDTDTNKVLALKDIGHPISRIDVLTEKYMVE